MLAVETVRSMGGGAEPGGPPIGGEAPPSGGPGADPVRSGGTDPAGPGGGGVPVADLDKPRGGGGVADFLTWSSAPPALLIQRFCSGS